MILRFVVRFAAVCAIAASGACLTPASAATCDTAGCQNPARSKPLALAKFMKKPVASAATRAVKTRDGSYVRASITRRAKPKPADAKPTDAKPEEAQTAPAAVADEATDAFAFHAASTVRVVSPDELNEIDLAADAAPMVTTAVEMADPPPAIDVVDMAQPAAIDQTANSRRAVSLDALNRQFAAPAPEKEPERTAWFQHMLIVLGGAFAAASAAVRLLIA